MTTIKVLKLILNSHKIKKPSTNYMSKAKGWQEYNKDSHKQTSSGDYANVCWLVIKLDYSIHMLG